jgi:hypothetical protein
MIFSAGNLSPPPNKHIEQTHKGERKREIREREREGEEVNKREDGIWAPHVSVSHNFFVG